jgi:hypothetical protein
LISSFTRSTDNVEAEPFHPAEALKLLMEAPRNVCCGAVFAGLALEKSDGNVIVY